MSTGLQFGQFRGEDRFYVPAKARKAQQPRPPSSGSKAVAAAVASASTHKRVAENDVVSAASPSPPCRSNLERFLDSTKPSVPAQYFSKTTMRGLRTCDVEFQHYFTLGDLWEFFQEWSAYGAGVPLLLDGSDSVVQYYVPYLSGIQLYGESTTSMTHKSRQVGEDSDGDYYRDSSSDGSCDYEFEKGMKLAREQCGFHHLTSEVPFRIGSLSVSDELSSIQEGFSSDDCEAGNSRDHLLFEFLEQDTPYGREPLANKVLDLARWYPGLNTLRSCDLLPMSWICVAWYPIYRIPTGPTLKDLDACFLTYHFLSTPMGGSGTIPAPVVLYPSDVDGVPKISLPVFGMASYKFKGSMRTQNGMTELQVANSLMQYAENWLRFLQVNHPDFQFFASHGAYCR